MPTAQPVEEKVCLTSGCVKTANKVMNNLDESIDPCDNFYEFACGNFMKETDIPADKVTVDAFSIVGDIVQEQLREIINEDELPGEAKPFVLAKRLNQACLNREVIEERGIKPLSDMLESFGGWPVVKGDLWSEDSFDWVETIKKFRLYGLETGIIFSFSVTTDLRNSSARVCDVNMLLKRAEYLLRFYLLIFSSDRSNESGSQPGIFDRRAREQVHAGLPRLPGRQRGHFGRKSREGERGIDALFGVREKVSKRTLESSISD